MTQQMQVSQTAAAAAAKTQTKALAKLVNPVDQMMAKVIDPDRKQRLANLLPPHYNLENYLAEVQFALAANPDLLKCTASSIARCVMDCAQMGLSPSGRLGSAWLVPFQAKGGVWQCTLIPGYRGLIDLAVRSGEVVAMKPVIVHARDKFKHREGTEQTLIHVPYMPAPDDAQQDPGPVICAYSVAFLPSGAKTFVTMSLRELDLIRGRSKAKKGPWFTDLEEMYKKTVIRRHVKTLPLSPQKAAHLARAMQLGDEEAEIEDVPTRAPRKNEPAVSITVERIPEAEEPAETDAVLEASTEPAETGPAADEPPADLVLPGEQPPPKTPEYAEWLAAKMRIAQSLDALKALVALRDNVPESYGEQLDEIYLERKAALGG